MHGEIIDCSVFLCVSSMLLAFILKNPDPGLNLHVTYHTAELYERRKKVGQQKSGLNSKLSKTATLQGDVANPIERTPVE